MSTIAELLKEKQRLFDLATAEQLTLTEREYLLARTNLARLLKEIPEITLVNNDIEKERVTYGGMAGYHLTFRHGEVNIGITVYPTVYHLRSDDQNTAFNTPIEMLPALADYVWDYTHKSRW